MSTSGCASTFPEIEIVKCVSRKTLAALHKIKQEKEVDEAALEGLEKCPCVSHTRLSSTTKTNHAGSAGSAPLP